MKKPPKILDAIADRVLAYQPKPKSKPAKSGCDAQKRFSGSHLYNSQMKNKNALRACGYIDGLYGDKAASAEPAYTFGWLAGLKARRGPLMRASLRR